MNIYIYIYIQFARLSGLEACMIASLPKLMVLCFIGGPLSANRTTRRPIQSTFSLHEPIWLDFLNGFV